MDSQTMWAFQHVQWNLCFSNSLITFSTLFHSQFSSFLIYLYNNIPLLDHSIVLCVISIWCSPLFIVVHISSLCKSWGWMMLKKGSPWKVFFRHVLIKSPMKENTLHSALTLYEISTSMSLHAFAVCPQVSNFP